MKKRIVLYCAGVMLLLLIGAGLLIPATVEETIQIRAPFQNIASTVLHLEEWKRWHPAFENSDTGSVVLNMKDKFPALVWDEKVISVKDQSPFGIRVKETGPMGEKHYSLNVVPQTDQTSYLVSLRKKVNLLQSLSRSVLNSNNQDRILHSLRQFIETPERYYGFLIRFGPVTDTIVVSRQQLIPEQDLYRIVPTMFQELNKYILREKINITGHPMLYASKRAPDSVMIMAGFAVDRLMKNEDEISFQTMPKGKMLIGHFEGPHGSVGKLMDVMRRYIADYSLQPAALPYQKFLDNVIPDSPAANVNCDVYFPVF